jgi:flagellar basal-body rod modification protein FlgD
VSTPITGASSAAAAAAGASSALKKDALGQDAFMKLLITQLTHQDPTQPKEDTEFIAQLATFSQLEKLTTIASAVTGLETISASMARLEEKLDALQKTVAAGTQAKATGATTSTTA